MRQLIKNDFDTAFNNIDAILTPSTPSATFKIGEKKDDPISMYLNDIFTVPTNLAGIPARLVGTVKISFKYMEIGSSFFSPILKVALGVDGVSIASILLKAVSKSFFINCLTFCAFR